mmetsp:Transcript_18642/g.16505  ORF Transcript_18642/g.16505 Transcript_18642/m.16505 type:complete len:209 (+) Transcript_18642:404-1030(+)
MIKDKRLLNKDKLLKKLVEILNQQERAMSEAYIHSNLAIGETIQEFKQNAIYERNLKHPDYLKLQKRVMTIDLTTKDRKINMDVVIELDQLNKATRNQPYCKEIIGYVLNEFEALKLVSHSAMNNYLQNYSTLMKIQNKHKYYEEIIEQKDNHYKNLKDEVKDRLKNKNIEMNNFKKSVNSEFDIKDKIIERLQEYNGVLMRELVFSK